MFEELQISDTDSDTVSVVASISSIPSCSSSTSSISNVTNINVDPTVTNSKTNTATTKRKENCGRKESDIWGLFTEEAKPHTLKSALCKNCKSRVNHHKKSEYAKNHLLKCLPFKKLIYGMPLEERPDWFPSKKIMQGESMF